MKKSKLIILAIIIVLFYWMARSVSNTTVKEVKSDTTQVVDSVKCMDTTKCIADSCK